MKKREAEILYKESDFLFHAESNTVLTYEGFVVSLSTSFKVYEKFKKHFRTDSFGLIMVLQGEGVIKINLMDYKIKKNHLLINSPNTVKQLISVSKNFRFLFVGFTTQFLNHAGLPAREVKVLDYFSTKLSPHWKLKVNDVELLKRLTFHLHYTVSSVATRPYGKEILRHAFFNFFYEVASLSGVYAHPLTLHFSRKEDLIIRFANLVGEQFRHQRNVQKYARQLNITPKYLTETVKEISGKNAGEIIDDFVILEAKILLSNPESSIGQVAEELHFSDQSFFGKFFKRHTGMSPKEYKSADPLTN